MATLESLVRINRWALDEKRRSLAEILRLVESFRAELARVDAELAAESAAASSAATVEATGAFAAYAEEARRRRAKLMLTLVELENAERTTREELATIFQEVKSYELALDRAERRKRSTARRREQAALDETGIALARRRG